MASDVILQAAVKSCFQRLHTARVSGHEMVQVDVRGGARGERGYPRKK